MEKKITQSFKLVIVTDIQDLADSIYQLTQASRFGRTAMYNAMQSTLLYNSDIEAQIMETSQDVVTSQIKFYTYEVITEAVVAPTVSIVSVTPIVSEGIANRT